MADQYLGYRYAILLGAVMMAIGEFLMVGGALGGPDAIATSEMLMLFGMGALIVGNGFFKANISTIVGKLYEDNDPRRDSGFTIFYIGINIGALLATTVVAFVGETYGFEYGFGLAGIGMLAGLFIFWSGRDNYAAAPGLDITEEGHKKSRPPQNLPVDFFGLTRPHPSVLLPDQPKRLDEVPAHRAVGACGHLPDSRGHQRRCPCGATA